MSTDSTELATKTTDELLDLCVEDASGAMVLLVREIARRGMEPTITTSGLISVSDHLLKVINSRKKPTDAPAGTGFSIVINLPGNSQPVVIGAQAARSGETLDMEPIDAPPPYLSVAGATVNFASAPEF